NNFIIKEFASCDGKRVIHHVFKPSVPFKHLNPKEKRTVQFLENHHHGLRYSDGIVGHNKIYEIIENLLFEETIDKSARTITIGHSASSGGVFFFFSLDLPVPYLLLVLLRFFGDDLERHQEPNNGRR